MTTTKLNTKQLNDYGFVNSIFRQALINPNCQVNQAITAVNLTSGKLFGPVDMFYAKGQGTAVSAGTITQSTSANVGNSGYALLLSGITLTGTGKVNAYTFIESLNAKLYKNKTASFSVKVYHDVGSAIDYVIKINKADSADNFSAVTNIASATAQSVPNTTETLIKLENVSLGDCSNGIEIEIEASCGAITTKNFQFTDWQFNEGSVVLIPVCGTFDEELRKCMRFYEKSFSYGVTPANDTAGNLVRLPFNSFDNTNLLFGNINFLIEKLKNPTMVYYNELNSTDGVWAFWTTSWQIGSSTSTAYISTRMVDLQVGATGLSANSFYFVCGHWVANARPIIA